MRLDVYLSTQGLCGSRARAQDAIQEGRVYVNGTAAKKSSMPVDETMDIQLIAAETAFASRAGFKLYDVLEPFAIDLKGRIVLDVGASTGGFSDVCLQNGARLVYAVDVGRDQLLERLKNDERIVNMEGTNCRYLHRDMFDPHPDFACMDVSFISIRQILPVLAEQFDDLEIVALVKPQFEAGRTKVGKHGIVKDEKVHVEVLQSMCDYVETLGLYVHHLCASSVLGRDGNKEFVMHLKHTENHTVFPIRDIVKNYTVKR